MLVPGRSTLGPQVARMSSGKQTNDCGGSIPSGPTIEKLFPNREPKHWEVVGQCVQT